MGATCNSCLGLQQKETGPKDFFVYGHVRNSQTRTLIAVFETAKLPYKFRSIDAEQLDD